MRILAIKPIGFQHQVLHRQQRVRGTQEFPGLPGQFGFSLTDGIPLPANAIRRDRLVRKCYKFPLRIEKIQAIDEILDRFINYTNNGIVKEVMSDILEEIISERTTDKNYYKKMKFEY